MFALSVAQLRGHLSRLLATCLAIIIAVGFVVATLVLNETSKTTIYQAVGAPYQHAATVITSNSSGISAPLDSRLLARVAKIPGVAAVSADRSAYAQVKIAGHQGYRLVQVTALAADQRLRWQRLAAGRLPITANEVVAGQQKDVRIGTKITLLIRPFSGDTSAAVTRTATVVGLLDLNGATDGQTAGSDLLFATTPQALHWGGLDPDAIRVAAAPGVNANELTDRIRAALSQAGRHGLTVRTGAAQTAVAATDFTRNAATITEVLLVFATVAVLVCGLVIANTFAVLLAQRTRELALLRCIGASGRQLRRGVLLESLIIGAVASTVGLGVGIGAAAAISNVAKHFKSPIPLSGVTVPARALVIGLTLGILITMMAAFLPARRATRVAPLAALRVQDPPPPRSRAGLLRRAAGIVLLIPSALILGYGAIHGRLEIAVGGGAVSFIAALLLAQWLVPKAVWLAGRLTGLTGRTGGVPGRLAAANALRNPQRTAATATALIIGVTLTAAMVVGAASTRATASSGLDDAFPTDVVIQDYERALPGAVVPAVTSVQNVQAALALPGADVRGPHDDVEPALGVDPAKAGAVVRSTVNVPKPGTVNVTMTTAQAWGVAQEGQELRLTVASRAVKLRVHLVHGDIPVIMTTSDLARLAPKARINTIWVRLADGLDAGARGTALDAVSAAASDRAPTSFVRGAFQERDGFDRIVNTLLLIVTGLLAIAVMIAVIGVGNTMALSVLERRQESGLLRALGLTRGQLRSMLLWEAMLIAGVAALLGTGLGVGYGLLGTSAALSGQTGLRIAIPWSQLLLIFTVATGAGALASVLPSRRAARISPVAAIAD